MKKLLFLLFIIIIFNVGCSKQVVENRAEVEKNIPHGLETDTGSGSVIVTTHVSNSEDGSIPIIYTDEKKGLGQLGLSSKNFDDSRSSYIYIDGKLNTIEKLGESSSVTLTICDENLKEGKHKIEVVQFDNDKTNGTPITYKDCDYEIYKR
ncbi:hypothetical protein LZ906_011290 [Paraclostridium ghonii]|uniref:hypothetical protein n=1 Tax=Paraclostridium ghonii TaxID=29358 RepID=UPI00202CB8B6|nr:hypothetical protein [Paeniclostridium ghonii]MCM0167566.1 hypothetical protein [Paeniclostridium ghonii]